MIIQALLTLVFSVVHVIIDILAIFPDMPEQVITVGETIKTYAIEGSGVLKKVFGETLISVILTLLATLIVAIPTWNLLNWLYNKIRG